MLRNKRRLIGSVLIILALAGGLGYTRYSDVYFQIQKNFTIFSDVFRIVTLDYVDKVNPTKLMKAGIDAMLNTLDPYTVLIDESDSQEIDILTKGKYAGIGLEVGVRGGHLVVIAPIQGYSAYRKGIKAGDIIESVNDKPVKELSPRELQNQLRGEPGTQVKLGIKRYGFDQPLHFDLTREEIAVHNVTFEGFVDPDSTIGYILLTQFAQNSGDEVHKAILKLESESKLKGLILDLRNNPGGLLSEAVKTVNNFVPPGNEVVRIKGRGTRNVQVYKTSEPAIYVNKPLIVLQNRGSASASEITAGALQDLDRAVIIGNRSFGKGLVQVIKPLAYNTSLKITTAKYYTPSGRCIQEIDYTHDDRNGTVTYPDSTRKMFLTRNGRKVYNGEGIEPDIYVKEPREQRVDLALRQQSKYFFFANEYVAKYPHFNSGFIRDSVFYAFKNYLNKIHFTYELPAQHYLFELKKSLQGTTIGPVADEKLVPVEKMIHTEREKEINNDASEIKNELYLELLSRYKGPKARIQAELKNDRDVQEAVKIIKHPATYNKILSGPKG